MCFSCRQRIRGGLGWRGLVSEMGNLSVPASKGRRSEYCPQTQIPHLIFVTAAMPLFWGVECTFEAPYCLEWLDRGSLYHQWRGSCPGRCNRQSDVAPQHQLQCVCHIPPLRYFCFEERQLPFLLIIDITQIFETERKQVSLVNLPSLQTRPPQLLVTFLLGSPASLTGYCLYNCRDLVPCGWKECASFGGYRGRSWWLEERSQKLSWNIKFTMSSPPPFISPNKIEQDGFAHGWSWKKVISSS